MAGRPTALTPDVQNQIVAALQRGSYLETAASFAGIHKATLHAWLAKAAKLKASDLPIIQPENQRLVEFHDAVEKAMAESEVRDVQAIDTAAQNGQWQAAAWKLERKHHARWGRKVALTDNEGGNFFTGMAKAWADALDSESDAIPGEVERPLLEGPNGDGRA